MYSGAYQVNKQASALGDQIFSYEGSVYCLLTLMEWNECTNRSKHRGLVKITFYHCLSVSVCSISI